MNIFNEIVSTSMNKQYKTSYQISLQYEKSNIDPTDRIIIIQCKLQYRQVHNDQINLNQSRRQIESQHYQENNLSFINIESQY